MTTDEEQAAKQEPPPTALKLVESVPITERRAVAYAGFVVLGLLVLTPLLPSERKDDFPLSPYGMFAEDKDEDTKITHAVAVMPDGAERPIPPRFLGTDEVLQAKATLANATGKRAAPALCKKIADRLKEASDWSSAKRVEIRTVSYHTISYFQDPKAPPKSKRVHARCDLSG